MFSLIGNILKYSAIVLTVLVLSHIIQVRGVTISRHVENTMHWFGGSGTEVVRVTQQLSSSVTNSVASAFHERGTRVERAPDSDVRASDISATDEKQLNHIILRTQKK